MRVGTALLVALGISMLGAVFGGDLMALDKLPHLAGGVDTGNPAIRAILVPPPRVDTTRATGRAVELDCVVVGDGLGNGERPL
jgi:hypothetical protein